MLQEPEEKKREKKIAKINFSSLYWLNEVNNGPAVLVVCSWRNRVHDVELQMLQQI